MPTTLSLPDARRAWSRAQHLGLPGDPLTVPGGWIRALGAADPYLSLRARCPDLQRSTIDQAIRDDELWVLPGVRGCIWLVPRQDVGLALAVSEASDRTRFDRDLTKAGSSVAEVQAVGEHVLAALEQAPLSTDQLRRALPEGSWRSLGEAGKKVGVTTTLPPSLRLLEWAGCIRRRHADCRLDNDRYTWQLTDQDPRSIGVYPTDPQDQALVLAHHFFTWSGPATLDDFTSWSKLGKRNSQAAIDELGLDAVQLEGLGPGFVTPGLLDGGGDGEDDRIHLVPGLDNLLSLRARLAVLVDPAHHHLQLPDMGTRLKPLAKASWPQVRAIVHRGQWKGAWEWSPDDAGITWAGFGSALDGLEDRVAAEIAGMERFIRSQLDGGARASGIDSDKRQQDRAAHIAALAS